MELKFFPNKTKDHFFLRLSIPFLRTISSVIRPKDVVMFLRKRLQSALRCALRSATNQYCSPSCPSVISFYFASYRSFASVRNTVLNLNKRLRTFSNLLFQVVRNAGSGIFNQKYVGVCVLLSLILKLFYII